MKNSYLIAGLIAVVGLVWVLSGLVMPSKKDGAAASQPPTAQAAAAKTMAVRVRDLVAEPVSNEVIVTGRTQASRKVELRAETAGQIAEILAEKGQEVAAGDVILRIEERDRKIRVTEAQERVRQREIEYKAAEALENQGFNSRIRLSQAKADLEAARAALKMAEIDLAKTQITAPFDGIVYNRNIDVGDYVAVGDVVYSLVDLDPVDIRGFVTEKNIDDITVGGIAYAELVNGVRVDGAVSYVAPAADEATRTFAVEISMPNPDAAIIEGMTAEMHIQLPQRKAHKISPSVLSLNDSGQIGVKIVDDGNHVQFVPVRILADKPEFMWVGGLPDKVRIITVGQEFVIQGQEVTPVPSDDAEGLL